MSLIIALYYLIIAFFISYWLYTDEFLDIFFFWDSSGEIIITAFKILGPLIWGLGLLFTILWAFLFLIIWNIAKSLSQLSTNNLNFKTNILLISCISVYLALIPAAHGYIFQQLDNISETTKNRSKVASHFPDNSIYNTQSNDNIFFLQLESGNSLALNGDLEIDGNKYDEDYMPNFRKIAFDDGILFPYVWGNTIQTNRAILSILCGGVGNISTAYSIKPDEIPTICLPQILQNAGYETIYFMGYADENFFNMKNFAKTIGFNKFISSQILQENDLTYPWGFDDCIFYNRIFEYLDENYSNNQNLFVYIEVTAHHFPFGMKEEYNFLNHFNPSVNFLEDYLNSALIQDHCLANFYEKYNSFKSHNTHLFSFADHSYPSGFHGITTNSHGAYNDNFLIPMMYIPPDYQQNEFNIGREIEKIYGQTDILPTLFELLNDKHYQNSVAFELKKDTPQNNYEECHIMTQPYSGASIAVVKGKDKYVYRFTDQILHYYDLENDWFEQNPIVMQENMTYDEFRMNYYCPRYIVDGKEKTLFEGEYYVGNIPKDKKWGRTYWKQLAKVQPDGQNFAHIFELETGTTIKQLEIISADADRVHKIYINDEYVGKICRTYRRKTACRVKLNKEIVIDKKTNEIVIKSGLDKHGKYDNFIIYSIRSVEIGD